MKKGKTMKKLLYSAPVLAIGSASAQTGGATSTGLTEQNVQSIADDLVTVGGYVAGAIGGVVAVAAGLRLVIKGINRAVGK